LEKVNLLIVVVDIDAVDALVERVVAYRVARLDFIEPIDVLQEPNQELCIDVSLATSWLYSSSLASTLRHYA